MEKETRQSREPTTNELLGSKNRHVGRMLIRLGGLHVPIETGHIYPRATARHHIDNPDHPVRTMMHGGQTR